MTQPDDVIEKLSKESTDEGVSVQGWIDYLDELIDSARSARDAAEGDLENEED